VSDDRDTDPGADPTWLGKDYPPKTPAELACENAKPREVVRGFADRWGSPWIVVPIGAALLGGLLCLFKHCG